MNKMRFSKDLYDGRSAYAVYTASGIEAGEMVQWDTGARKATPMTAASGAIFLGVNLSAHPVVSLGTASQPLDGSSILVKANGLFLMQSTQGEVYSHRDPLFIGGTTQTVTKVGDQKRLIGRAWLPMGTQVTGASGVMVPTLLYGDQTQQGVLPSASA